MHDRKYSFECVFLGLGLHGNLDVELAVLLIIEQLLRKQIVYLDQIEGLGHLLLLKRNDNNLSDAFLNKCFHVVIVFLWFWKQFDNSLENTGDAVRGFQIFLKL